MPIEMNEDSISNLLDPTTSPSANYINQRVAEGHYRIVSPLLAMALGLVASVGVLWGQIRPSTWSRRTFITVAIGIACITALVSARSLATQIAELRALIYLSMLFPLVVAYGLIVWPSLRAHQIPDTRNEGVMT